MRSSVRRSGGRGPVDPLTRAAVGFALATPVVFLGTFGACVGYLDADAGVALDGSLHREAGGDSHAEASHDAGRRDARNGADARIGRDVGVEGDSLADITLDAPSPSTLHVEGNQLIDHGKPVQIRGIFRAGTQYACVEGNDMIFDSVHDQASVTAMLGWKVNAVRLPLNESCWFGTAEVPVAVSGTAYQSAIQGYVELLRQNGLYVILDLHWAAPGSDTARGHIPMPDRDHSDAFWASVATTFATDLGILFNVYSEPAPSDGTVEAYGPSNIASETSAWECWANGCQITNSDDGAYTSVGLLTLLGKVRETANNVVIMPGIASGADLSGWLAAVGGVTATNFVAGYQTAPNAQACADAGCWRNVVADVAARYPVISTNVNDDTCSDSFIDQYLPWADEAGVSYVAATWNADYSCDAASPGLITSYDGAPTLYGAGYKAHLAPSH